MKKKVTQEATAQGLNIPKIKSAAEEARGFEKFMYNTSKRLVWLLTINGILWIWSSYILAWMGKEQIAESLSSTVCTVILGELMTYLLTKTVENVFRYNPKFGGESTFPEDIVARETAMAQAQYAVAQAQAQTPSFTDDLMSEADTVEDEVPAENKTENEATEPVVDPSVLD